MTDPLWRIVDANANRAREALRVLEDAARFALSDAEASGAFKHVRHALTAALAPLDPLRLVASRDAGADVGREIKGAGEGSRDGIRGVALAAASRLGEALRSLEESLKALALLDAASRVERARYESYDAARVLVLALPAPRVQWRLCVLITQSLCTHHAWDEVARRALAGGADCLQLREKDLPTRELLARARRLVDLARPLGAAVVVNDRVDVALAAGADGAHLGSDDLPIAEARALAGSRLRLGRSTRSADEARAVRRQGADYVGIGPMFATTTKPMPVLAGPGALAVLAGAPDLADLPHLAIGGITPENAGVLAAAGARGLAVSACVCGSKEPTEACRRLIAALAAPVGAAP